MNEAIVSRTLSLIPERVIRTQSGSLFEPKASGACAHPERITHLAQFLNWLGPLREVSKDDLRIFGLLTQYGRPVVASPLEDEADAEVDADVDLEPLPEEVVATEVAREPALT
jgi:hypothetical protein